MAHVAVLAGGPSSEHDVSLLTSRCVLKLLREGGHRARAVLIDRQAAWHVGPPGEDLEAAGQAPAQQAEQALAGLAARGETAFLGLHGPFGEDGTVQRLLEQAGVAYTGSGPQASELCMDKQLSKLAAMRLGARCAGHQVVSEEHPPWSRIAQALGTPCFVKPLSCGSSVGAGRVDDPAALPAAVAAARQADPAGRALVEAFVPGDELTCAVLRLQGTPTSLPLVAIRPAGEFYDYHAKYESEQTRLQCPAQVSAGDRDSITRLALGLFEALELRGVARVDMILPREGGAPVFLELNTLPGFTEHSLVPLAARAAGLAPGELLAAILADARSPA